MSHAHILVPTQLLRSVWPPNPGLMPGDEQFDAMLVDVRENGILEPLTARLNWELIDGHHRLFAAKMLGIERVPVQFWTGVEMVL